MAAPELNVSISSDFENAAAVTATEELATVHHGRGRGVALAVSHGDLAPVAVRAWRGRLPPTGPRGENAGRNRSVLHDVGGGVKWLGRRADERAGQRGRRSRGRACDGAEERRRVRRWRTHVARASARPPSCDSQRRSSDLRDRASSRPPPRGVVVLVGALVDDVRLAVGRSSRGSSAAAAAGSSWPPDR